MRRSWLYFAMRSLREAEPVLIPEHGVDGNIHYAQRGCRGMPEVQELVAIGEVKETRADSVQANFRASRQKVSAYVRRGYAVCIIGPIRHDVSYLPIGTSALAPHLTFGRNLCDIGTL